MKFKESIRWIEEEQGSRPLRSFCYTEPCFERHQELSDKLKSKEITSKEKTELSNNFFNQFKFSSIKNKPSFIYIRITYPNIQFHLFFEQFPQLL